MVLLESQKQAEGSYCVRLSCAKDFDITTMELEQHTKLVHCYDKVGLAIFVEVGARDVWKALEASVDALLLAAVLDRDGGALGISSGLLRIYSALLESKADDFQKVRDTYVSLAESCLSLAARAEGDLKPVEEVGKMFSIFVGHMAACKEHPLSGLQEVCDTLKVELQDKVEEECKASLASSIAELSRLGLGGANGAVWKAAVPRGAPFQDVVKAAAPIMEGKYVVSLKNAFKNASQEQREVVTLYPCCVVGPCFSLRTPSSQSCSDRCLKE